MPFNFRLTVVRYQEAVLCERLLVSEAREGTWIGGYSRGNGGRRPQQRQPQETASDLSVAEHQR